MHHDASWCIMMHPKISKGPKHVRQDKGIRFKRFTVEVLLSILSAGRRAPGCLFMRMLQSPMRFLPQQLSIQSLVTVMAVVRFQRVSNMSPDRKNISESNRVWKFSSFFLGQEVLSCEPLLCIPLGWNLNPFFMHIFKIWIQMNPGRRTIYIKKSTTI